MRRRAPPKRAPSRQQKTRRRRPAPAPPRAQRRWRRRARHGAAAATNPPPSLLKTLRASARPGAGRRRGLAATGPGLSLALSPGREGDRGRRDCRGGAGGRLGVGGRGEGGASKPQKARCSPPPGAFAGAADSPACAPSGLWRDDEGLQGSDGGGGWVSDGRARLIWVEVGGARRGEFGGVGRRPAARGGVPCTLMAAMIAAGAKRGRVVETKCVFGSPCISKVASSGLVRGGDLFLMGGEERRGGRREREERRGGPSVTDGEGRSPVNLSLSSQH